MGREQFGTRPTRVVPRRARTPEREPATGRASTPFSDAPGAASAWIARIVTTVAVGALGLALAGSLSLVGDGDAASAGRTTADLPDTTRAVPVQAAGQDDAGAAGRDGGRVDDRSLGTLDGHDRRRHSTSRDTVRKKLQEAGVSQRAQERRRQLDTAHRDAARNNRGLSARERTKDLERTRQRASEEAERQHRAEKERQRQQQRERQRAAQGSGGLPAPAPEGLPGSTGAVAPLPPGSYVLGARWGAWGSWARYHTGQDLAAPYGTPIVAAKAGVVVPGTGGWAGIDVAIRHAGGGATLYAHMSRRVVSVGQTVSAGQIIGYVGNTGRSFGPHLHFEYYPPGTRVGDVYATRDPISWLRANGGQV